VRKTTAHSMILSIKSFLKNKINSFSDRHNGPLTVNLQLLFEPLNIAAKETTSFYFTGFLSPKNSLFQ
jgi:hypothetical protein